MGQSGSTQTTLATVDNTRLVKLENLITNIQQALNNFPLSSDVKTALSNLDARLVRLESLSASSSSPTSSSSSSSTSTAITSAITNLDSRLNQTITNVNQLMQDVSNIIKVVNSIPKTGITPEIDAEFKIIYKNFDTIKPQYGYYVWEADGDFYSDGVTMPTKLVIGNLNLFNSQKTAWVLKPNTHYIFYIGINAWSNGTNKQEYYLGYLNDPKKSIYGTYGLDDTLSLYCQALPNITATAGRPYITCPFFNNSNINVECVIGIKQPTSSTSQYGFLKKSSWVLIMQI